MCCGTLYSCRLLLLLVVGVVLCPAALFAVRCCACCFQVLCSCVVGRCIAVGCCCCWCVVDVGDGCGVVPCYFVCCSLSSLLFVFCCVDSYVP